MKIWSHGTTTRNDIPFSFSSLRRQDKTPSSGGSVVPHRLSEDASIQTPQPSRTLAAVSSHLRERPPPPLTRTQSVIEGVTRTT